MTNPVPAPPSVLVVGDPEGAVAPAIAADLAWQGYEVELRAPAADLASELDGHRWEFMILDLATAESILPSSADERPRRIVLVPPNRPEETIRALADLGACAVLETPPHPGVLKATLFSLCRHFSAAPPEQATRADVRADDEVRSWQLRTTSWTLVCPCGKTIALTKAEMGFLQALARVPGDAVARSRLIADMGHSVDYYDARRLDTFVSRLRQKVLNACGVSLPLRAIHAFGYVFAAGVAIVD